MDIAAYQGPLVVTLLLVLVYYGTMIHGMVVKLRLTRAYAAKGERFDRYFGQDREMLASDRMQLNLLEHMPPFLVLLWLHAVFVSVDVATAAGAVYVAARALYPFALGFRVGRNIRALTLAATVPGYLVLIGLAGGLVVSMFGA